jgi:uncharacterized protein YciI
MNDVVEGSTGMAVFAVTYVYDHRTAERDLYRPAHRGYLRELLDEGVLIAAGAWADESSPGALLLFRAAAADDVAARIRIDPYVVHGIVTAADIREWTATIGPFAQT